MLSSPSTSSSSVRYRLSSRTSAVITRSIATRQWSITSMQPPSAQTMPSTTRTSTITWLRSSNGTAGASSPCTSETRCTTMRNIFSSTRRLPGSKGSCRSSTARTTKTLSSPFSQPVSAMAATASARISLAKSSPSPRKICSNTAPMAPMPSIPSTSERRNFRIGMRSASRLQEFCSGCERRSPREWDCSACRPLAGARSQRKTHRKNSRSTILSRCQRAVYCRIYF